MDPFKDFYYLGKITTPNGYRGKLNAYLDTDEPDAYAGLKMVYVNQNGNLVPYFIESIVIKNNKAVFSLDSIETIGEADLLLQKDLYLPLSELPALSGKKFYFHEVEGFTIDDKTHGKIGQIKTVLEYPNQSVFQVFKNNKEILIPINDRVIRKVDRENKTINIEAPEGLIELYLE